MRSPPSILAGLLLAAALSACDDPVARSAIERTGGNPARGRAVIRAYGCGTCHTIPGVPGAAATVGPPLAGVGGRTYLAGVLQNTPPNMMRWILTPQDVDSLTAMPNLGLSEDDARDVAAYLYTLR
jgi:cytochrome c1